MKKITKFLDSVMGGIKRTCIAKALAVFAVASIAINANAQEPLDPQGVITGIDKLVGKTENELMAAKVKSSDAFPTKKSKIFFLYNVKSGKFLTAGGYWGTHASIADYGKPMCVENESTIFYTSTWNFRFDMQTGTGNNQGKYLLWAVPNSGKEKETGVFVDRARDSGYGWVLQAVRGKTATYKLYTNTKSDGSGDKCYLCAYKDQVYADRSCEAYTTTQITEKGLTGYDEWRFFTYDQIYELQKNNADKMNKSLELSFRLKAPGFERGNKEITAWKHILS